MIYYVLISGASRGLGRCIALEFARNIPLAASCVFSLGSSPDSARQLETLKSDIMKLRGNEIYTDVRLVSEDFCDTNELERISERFVLDPSSILTPANKEKVAHVIFISNAGTLGPLNRVEALELSQITKAYDLNITSSTYLTSKVLQKYGSCKDVHIQLVNISSLAAVQPFSNWSLYCAGKAARDMFFRVVAQENVNADSNVRVLNYAPGPLDTDMQKEIRESRTYQDDATKKAFIEMKETGTLVDPIESASKVCISYFFIVSKHSEALSPLVLLKVCSVGFARII